MSIQTATAMLTALMVLALAAVFLHVRRNAHDAREQAPVQHRAYRIRAFAFGVMVLLGLPASAFLLRFHPYALQVSPQVVHATATQWFWDFDRSTLTAGQPVEFRLTSTDVNHGFGLYDESGRLVAQAQAMPGYVNRLTHVFATPGIYRVMCLEYCGLAHHDMQAELTVTSGKGGSDG